MSDDRLRVLRAVKELAGLDEAQLRALLPFVDEAHVPAGTQLAHEGAFCHQLIIVATGALESCRRGVRSNLGPGDTFGWQAMRDRGCCDASVRTVTCAQLLVMSHAQFRAIGALDLAT